MEILEMIRYKILLKCLSKMNIHIRKRQKDRFFIIQS